MTTRSPLLKEAGAYENFARESRSHHFAQEAERAEVIAKVLRAGDAVIEASLNAIRAEATAGMDIGLTGALVDYAEAVAAWEKAHGTGR